MNSNEKEVPVDYNKPVAYDVNGRPLYAHPPVVASSDVKAEKPQHIAETKLKDQIITDNNKPKHETNSSNRELNLSDGEYVILSIKRHFIGLFLPMLLGLVLLISLIVLLSNVGSVVEFIAGPGMTFDSALLILPILLFTALVSFGIYVAYYVYKSSKMFLTNESIIQITQKSIFSKREQLVSLQDIENVSFSQNGIIQQIFNFGSIKLSGEGAERVYRLSFVADPKSVIDTINDAVEKAKKNIIAN